MSGLSFGISESWKWNKSHSCHFTLTPSSSIIHTTEERCSSAVGSTFHFVLSCGWGACQKPPKKDPSSDYRGLGKKCTGTWMDTVDWTDSHYCAFAEHRAAQVISAIVSRQFCTNSLSLTPPVTPNAPLQSQMKAQGSDSRWLDVLTSPPEQLLGPQRPRKKTVGQRNQAVLSAVSLLPSSSMLTD